MSKMSKAVIVILILIYGITCVIQQLCQLRQQKMLNRLYDREGDLAIKVDQMEKLLSATTRTLVDHCEWSSKRIGSPSTNTVSNTCDNYGHVSPAKKEAKDGEGN